MEASQAYEAQLEQARLRIARLDILLQRLVWIRSAFFFAAAASFVLAWGGQIAYAITLPLACLLSVAFLVAIIWNEHLRLNRLSAVSDHSLFQHLLARLRRDWSNLPAQSFLLPKEAPAYADDLDLAGPSSLLSFVSLAATQPGRTTLQRWLSQPPAWPEVTVRQQAVRGLVPARHLRLNLLQRLFRVSFQTQNPAGLAQWAESASWLQQHPVARGLSYLGPLLIGVGTATLLATVATRPGGVLAQVGFITLAVGVGINLLLTLLWGGWIQDIFHRVSGEHHATRRFHEVFEMLCQLPSDGGLLDQIRDVCSNPNAGAVAGLHRLNRLVRLASLQRNLISYLLYLLLQLTLAWDFRVLKLLEAWQRRHGSLVGDWFSALGTCEALISMATLADENPGWCFPRPCTDESLHWAARSMGHPLLANECRIANDVQLTRAQPLLLVTGSNMAGKSTLIRAVGLNVLLARTGGPVCAAEWAMPMFELATSMRVRDSLKDGVSYFMAELRRLKSVIDLAARHSQDSAHPLLFLLDEILQGTNSRERQIAVAQVVQQLIRHGAAGLLSTHDLELTRLETLASIAQVVHFREHFERDPAGQQVMRFDYLIHPGVAPTTNALKLLEWVGLQATDP